MKKHQMYGVFIVFLTFALALFSGCAGLQAGLPESDVGKANFFDGSLRALANQHNTEAAVATSPEYIKILKARRIAILNAIGPARTISIAVTNGQPISIGMLDSVNIALMQIKQHLLVRHRATPAEPDIWKLLQQAGVYTRTDQKVLKSGDKAPWLAIIEIIQGVYVMWQQLNWQANMSQEQLAADFVLNHNWIMGFTEADLVTLN